VVPSLDLLPAPDEVQGVLAEFRRVLTDDGVLNVAFKIGDGKTTQDRWGDSVTEYHLDEATAVSYVEATGFSIIDTLTHSNADRTFKNILCRSTSGTAAKWELSILEPKQPPFQLHDPPPARPVRTPQ
jgi:hypothetical protein